MQERGRSVCGGSALRRADALVRRSGASMGDSTRMIDSDFGLRSTMNGLRNGERQR